MCSPGRITQPESDYWPSFSTFRTKCVDWTTGPCWASTWTSSPELACMGPFPLTPQETAHLQLYPRTPRSRRFRGLLSLNNERNAFGIFYSFRQVRSCESPSRPSLISFHRSCLVIVTGWRTAILSTKFPIHISFFTLGPDWFMIETTLGRRRFYSEYSDVVWWERTEGRIGLRDTIYLPPQSAVQLHYQPPANARCSSNDAECRRVAPVVLAVAADVPAYAHALPACINTGHRSADSMAKQLTLLMQLGFSDLSRH